MQKDKLRLENPRISASQLNKQITQSWTSLNDQDKEIYEDLAK